MIKLQYHPTIKKAYAHLAIAVLLTLKFIIELLADFGDCAEQLFKALPRIDYNLYQEMEADSKRREEEDRRVAESGE